MLLTSFEDSFFWDLIEEVWSKIHNSQSKVDDKYELCLINVVLVYLKIEITYYCKLGIKQNKMRYEYE